MSVCETLPLRVPLPGTAAHSPSTCSPTSRTAHQLLSQINYVVSALKEGRQNRLTFCLCRHAGRFQSYVVPSVLLALSSLSSQQVKWHRWSCLCLLREGGSQNRHLFFPHFGGKQEMDTLALLKHSAFQWMGNLPWSANVGSAQCKAEKVPSLGKASNC